MLLFASRPPVEWGSMCKLGAVQLCPLLWGAQNKNSYRQQLYVNNFTSPKTDKVMRSVLYLQFLGSDPFFPARFTNGFPPRWRQKALFQNVVEMFMKQRCYFVSHWLLLLSWEPGGSRQLACLQIRDCFMDFLCIYVLVNSSFCSFPIEGRSNWFQNCSVICESCGWEDRDL